MHLDLTDEETAALTQELHDIVESNRYPFSPRIHTLNAILAEAQAGASPRPLAAAEGLCAAASEEAAWLGVRHPTREVRPVGWPTSSTLHRME
jgi:hypothetical protein